MTRLQKIWFWISLSLFLIPEILFSPLISLVAFFFGVENFPSLIYRFISQQFFLDNQFYSFIILIIEIVGVIGLLIYNKKFSRNISVAILLFVILIILILLLYVGFSLRHGISL